MATSVPQGGRSSLADSAPMIRARPLLARAHGLAARRLGPHGALQLALRPPPRRHVPPPHRGHRPAPAPATSGSSASRTRCAGSASTGTRGRSSRARASHEYLAAADELLGAGQAYECFCTEDEVQGAQRRGAARRAARPATTGTAVTSRPSSARRSRPRAGRASIRFRTPDEGVSHFVDAIRGDVRVEWSTISDFVIVRSDGTPIFFLANAVDDLDDGDHPRDPGRGPARLDAPGARAARGARRQPDRPVYAHLPLILGPDRAKLSKRHGAVALEEFRDAGYLPEALVQLPRAARLGARRRPRGDGRSTRSSPRSTSTASRTRPRRSTTQKLDWMNGEWIRRLTLAAARGARAAARPGRGSANGSTSTCFREALRIGQERAVTLGDLRRADGLPVRRRRRVRDRRRRRGSGVDDDRSRRRGPRRRDRAPRDVRVDGRGRRPARACIDGLGI